MARILRQDPWSEYILVTNLWYGKAGDRNSKKKENIPHLQRNGKALQFTVK